MTNSNIYKIPWWTNVSRKRPLISQIEGWLWVALTLEETVFLSPQGGIVFPPTPHPADGTESIPTMSRAPPWLLGAEK